MADDANDDMDTKPKRAQQEQIPPADPNYPEYSLRFSSGVNVGRISGIFGQEIPGSHTLVISAGSRRVRISYEHHDSDDPKPMLNVLIEDLGDGPSPAPRKPKKAAKKTTKKAAKKTARKAAKKGAKKAVTKRRR